MQKSKIKNQKQVNFNRPKKEIKTYIFDNQDHSTKYYLIANVFQKPIYAKNFINELKQKNIIARSFFNPLNKLTYIYIESDQNQEEIEKKYNSIQYDGELWIAKIVANKKMTESKFDLKIRHKIEISKLILPKSSNLKKGYYLVTNVFEIPSNATKYFSFLKKKHPSTGMFLNPKNNFYYVFLEYYLTQEDAEKAYNSNFDNQFFDEYWIKEVVLE